MPTASGALILENYFAYNTQQHIPHMLLELLRCAGRVARVVERRGLFRRVRPLGQVGEKKEAKLERKRRKRSQLRLSADLWPADDQSAAVKREPMK